MSVRHLLVAHVLAPPVPTDAFTLTSGRLWSLVGAALGVAGLLTLVTVAIGLLTGRDAYRETPMAAIREA